MPGSFAKQVGGGNEQYSASGHCTARTVGTGGGCKKLKVASMGRQSLSRFEKVLSIL